MPDPDDCTYLLGRMPATTNRLVFGRSGYPDLNVELPYVIKERKDLICPILDRLVDRSSSRSKMHDYDRQCGNARYKYLV